MSVHSYPVSTTNTDYNFHGTVYKYREAARIPLSNLIKFLWWKHANVNIIQYNTMATARIILMIKTSEEINSILKFVCRNITHLPVVQAMIKPTESDLISVWQSVLSNNQTKHVVPTMVKILRYWTSCQMVCIFTAIVL